MISIIELFHQIYKKTQFIDLDGSCQLLSILTETDEPSNHFRVTAIHTPGRGPGPARCAAEEQSRADLLGRLAELQPVHAVGGVLVHDSPPRTDDVFLLGEKTHLKFLVVLVRYDRDVQTNRLDVMFR